MSARHSPIKTALKEEISDFVTWGLFILDIVGFCLAAQLAYSFRHSFSVMPESYVLITLGGIAVFVLVLKLMGMYRFGSLFNLTNQLMKIITAAIAAIVSCLAALFFLKFSAEISRLWMLYWLIGGIAVTSCMHFLVFYWFRYQLKQGAYIRKVILIGNSKELDLIAAHCKLHNILVVATYVTKNMATKAHEVLDKKAIFKNCLLNKIDDIILTSDFARTDAASNEVLYFLRQMPAAVRYCLPEIFHNKGVRIAKKWDGLPLVTLYRKPMLSHQTAVKRVFDIVISATLIVLLSPLFLVLALIIKLTSQGPAFFVQQRGGFGGDRVNVIKFRSMKTLDDGTQKIKQAQKNDPRITPIGKFIRKSNLDELPQLFNVLKGDMSLIGPRPHALSHDNEYSNLINSYAARHRMKPGISGWAQVNGLRGETDTIDKMEARIAYDLYYIENWSLALDIKILLATPFTFLGKNAY